MAPCSTDGNSVPSLSFCSHSLFSLPCCFSSFLAMDWGCDVELRLRQKQTHVTYKQLSRDSHRTLSLKGDVSVNPKGGWDRAAHPVKYGRKNNKRLLLYNKSWAGIQVKDVVACGEDCEEKLIQIFGKIRRTCTVTGVSDSRTITHRIIQEWRTHFARHKRCVQIRNKIFSYHEKVGLITASSSFCSRFRTVSTNMAVRGIVHSFH